MNEAIPGLKIVELDLYENNNPVSALITDFPKDLALDFFGEETATPVQTSRKRDANKQYISWGSNNRMPSEIIARASGSPYVAPSLKHLIDSTFSAGLKMVYVYYTYSNGKMERNQIDYEAAGEWIKNKIKDLSTSGYQASNKEEIERLKKGLKTWEETNNFLTKFQEDNNLALWLYEQASDSTYFWNWFSLLKLNIGDPNKEWDPKIVELSHLEAVYTRKGLADNYGRVNYCVYSRSFADDINNSEQAQQDYMQQTIIDALHPNRAAAHLREIVNKQKDFKVANRKLMYALPMSIPTPGKFYYAFPSWWSIFKSRIYNYMLAMFMRRAMLMENSTMFKYIIHLDEEYVKYECNRRNATSDTDRQKVFNELIQSISSFIKDPKNNGKTMISMSTTINGQKVKWVEIETIESPMKGSDVKEDIAEIANVMLFAMGIHPQTVGAIPGKDKVASGTEARELNTLQQLYLFPIKLLLMTPLYVIKSFNRLDQHLYFDIPVHVLTTLDKNKQGVEEMKN